jgi:hypothetical protein
MAKLLTVLGLREEVNEKGMREMELRGEGDGEKGVGRMK